MLRQTIMIHNETGGKRKQQKQKKQAVEHRLVAKGLPGNECAKALVHGDTRGKGVEGPASCKQVGQVEPDPWQGVQT